MRNLMSIWIPIFSAFSFNFDLIHCTPWCEKMQGKKGFKSESWEKACKNIMNKLMFNIKPCSCSLKCIYYSDAMQVCVKVTISILQWIQFELCVAKSHCNFRILHLKSEDITGAEFEIRLFKCGICGHIRVPCIRSSYFLLTNNTGNRMKKIPT